MQVFYLEESYEAKLLWHKTIVLSSFAEDQYETIITEIPLDNVKKIPPAHNFLFFNFFIQHKWEQSIY